MRLALLRGNLADHADQLGLLRVRAVREVQARDIQAGADQLAKDLRRAAGGTKGGDDLGAAVVFHSRRAGNTRAGHVISWNIHEILRSLSGLLACVRAEHRSPRSDQLNLVS